MEIKLNEQEEKDTLITPFIVRSMVEVSFTSMVAKLDPFRILTLAKIQGQAEYDPSKKVTSAFQWKGDVIADKPNNIWDTSKKANEMTRALLGDYQDEIFWQPAFLKLLDYLSQKEKNIKSQWLYDLRNIQPTGLIPKFRGQATSIYSNASKGVHHEFVLSISKYYDSATLNQLAEDTMQLIATMGLIANFAENIAYGLTEERAVSHYENLSS